MRLPKYFPLMRPHFDSTYVKIYSDKRVLPILVRSNPLLSVPFREKGRVPL